MEGIKNSLKVKFKPEALKKILYVVAAVIIALLIFQTGVIVGFHKAKSAFKFGDNYYRNFGGERGDMMGKGFGIMRDGFPNSHGTVGKVINITLPNIIVLGEGNIEKVVILNEGTLIQKFRDTIGPEDLKVDDFVVVIGNSNEESKIEAKFVRIVPPPPFFNTEIR